MMIEIHSHRPNLDITNDPKRNQYRRYFTSGYYVGKSNMAAYSQVGSEFGGKWLLLISWLRPLRIRNYRGRAPGDIHPERAILRTVSHSGVPKNWARPFLGLGRTLASGLTSAHAFAAWFLIFSDLIAKIPSAMACPRNWDQDR